MGALGIRERSRPRSCNRPGPRRFWTDNKLPATGAGVAVAVLDTGIAGDLADFRDRESGASRVVRLGRDEPGRDHGNRSLRPRHACRRARRRQRPHAGRDRPAVQPLYRYGAGGGAGLRQGVRRRRQRDRDRCHRGPAVRSLDDGADYGVRVVNLSLASSLALPYRVDPLDAAVEAAWLRGIVVVAAAGNRGSDPGAVDRAPANDPFVITVGAVYDRATKDTEDDTLAPWSSRGITQDGVAKPDLLAPGAHIAAPLAPESDFAALCPSCVVDGRYFRVGGTSMAAPIVAGIAADLLSVPPDVDAGPGQGRADLPRRRRRRKPPPDQRRPLGGRSRQGARRIQERTRGQRRTHAQQLHRSLHGEHRPHTRVLGGARPGRPPPVGCARAGARPAGPASARG